jgi:hypothetical protein
VSVLAGEYPAFMGTNYKTIRRLQLKDQAGVLQYKFLEPIPVRPSESVGVITTSGSPFATLLWIEFLASAEGQKIMDELEPFGASVWGPGTIQGQEIAGKKLSLVDWEHYTRLGEYQAKVVAAYGFPKAELKR